MKRAIILAAILALMASTVAFAGPLVGLGFQPAENSTATIFFGWQSQNDWAATIGLEKLDTWKQTWTIGALWTPALWGDTVTLRAGGDVKLHWDESIAYKGFDLRIGAEKWLTDQFGVWGELRIDPNLHLYPVVGLDLNFWMPSANEEPTT